MIRHINIACCWIFQVTFIATDGGTPSKSSPPAVLTVNVNRNRFPPEILNLANSTGINEDQALNVEIFNVNARDNDTVVRYILLNILKMIFV